MFSEGGKEAQKAYFIALGEFQKECPVIEKKKKVPGKNGKTRYKYAPIEDIVSDVRDLIVKNGFSYMIKTDQDETSITAICFAYHKEGHSEASTFKIPIDKTAYMNESQKIASAFTFAKRYAFCNLFGIMTGDEDDDSNYSGEPELKPEQSKKENQKQGFSTAPEENQKTYKTIMHLIREKENNQNIFPNEEKIKYKQAADIVFFDLEKIKSLYQSIAKIVEDRRKKMRREII